MFSVMLTSKSHRVRMRWRNTMELSMISPLSPNLFLMKAAADPIIFSDRLLVVAAYNSTLLFIYVFVMFFCVIEEA